MTYRADSDIPLPHGWVEPLNKPRLQPRRSTDPPHVWIPYDEQSFLRTLARRSHKFRSLARRPRLAAWMPSRCSTNSEQEVYVRELSEFLQVDVMGECGSIRCGRDKTG